MKRSSLVLAVLISSLPISAQTWTEFAVGPNYTYPAAINNRGQVTGSYTVPNTNGSKAFIRNADGTLIRIQSNGQNSGSASINNSGEVVGYAGKSGFHRLPDGTFQTLSVYCCATSAVAVNGAGYKAGTFFLNWRHKIRAVYLMDATGKYLHFTFPHDSYPHDSVSIEVGGLNNSNQIAGRWTAYGNGVLVRHGFLYDSGTITQLDMPGAAVTQPRAINDSGEIVGDWTDSAGVTHGFLWTAAHGFTLFDAPQATLTSITAINSIGVTVGYFSDGKADHGFVLSPEGAVTILNAPHASSTIPSGINARGQVTGLYIGSKFAQKGFIYTPAL
jgi:probable HAF family extracellular repeat protein